MEEWKASVLIIIMHRSEEWTLRKTLRSERDICFEELVGINRGVSFWLLVGFVFAVLFFCILPHKITSFGIKSMNKSRGNTVPPVVNQSITI